MRFPASIGQIDLDATGDRVAAVNPDRGIAKIGTSFAIPCAHLHNFNLFAAGRDEFRSEFAGELSCLNLQLARIALRWKQRPFADVRRFSYPGVIENHPSSLQTSPRCRPTCSERPRAEAFDSADRLRHGFRRRFRIHSIERPDGCADPDPQILRDLFG